MLNGEEYLTADEACAFLEVKTSTLYAYVSRGLLRSYQGQSKRGRLYRKSEVSRLRVFGPADSQDTPRELRLPAAESWIPYT
jgi:excisionase family DNA binding protein